MQKKFTFSRKTIISRWEDSTIINCEDDREFIRLIKNQKAVMNLMLPSKIIRIISREENCTTLYQRGFYMR
jgi:hypothetical protein